MELHLQGKVVMVAAASRGLGYGIAQAVAADVTDPRAMLRWVETTLARFDRIDGLAGTATYLPAHRRGSKSR